MSALMSALPASERAAASSTDLDMESFVKKECDDGFQVANDHYYVVIPIHKSSIVKDL